MKEIETKKTTYCNFLAVVKVVLLEMFRLKDCYILGHQVSKGTKKGSDLGLEKSEEK